MIILGLNHHIDFPCKHMVQRPPISRRLLLQIFRPHYFGSIRTITELYNGQSKVHTLYKRTCMLLEVSILP